ncbi:MAG: GSCFA domain-containing protein [Bacteroidales bacterium]
MEFRTLLQAVPSHPKIGYDNKLLLLGSCFTEHIGGWLEDHYFDALTNPFGVIFNPESVARSLQNLLEEKVYTESELFEYKGIWSSFDHHSRFSSTDPQHALRKMNDMRATASEQLKNADFLIVTFGTAWVFTHREEARVVSNCHKLPERVFERTRLSVTEIVTRWSILLRQLLTVNPGIRVIFTVSPIRHLKDSLHGNQLSKASLLLAIEELNNQFENTSYFPSYELLLDDLRDYRFYAEDMVHPADIAITYIRNHFSETYFTNETRDILRQCEKLNKSIHHKPQNPASDAYKCFLIQNIASARNLLNKNHFLTLQKPLAALQSRLDRLENATE